MADITNVNELSVADSLKYDADTGDVFTTAWANYGDTSTIVGWATFTEKHIYLKKVGNLVFCSFYLRGESNSEDVSFTIPYVSTNYYFINGVSANLDAGELYLGSVGNVDGIVNVHKQLTNGAFANSGTKECRGSFWFEAGTIV